MERVKIVAYEGSSDDEEEEVFVSGGSEVEDGDEGESEEGVESGEESGSESSGSDSEESSSSDDEDDEEEEEVNHEEVYLEMKQAMEDDYRREVVKDGRIMCRMCLKEPAKYKCPRCGIRTCSVACCTAHKDGAELPRVEDNESNTDEVAVVNQNNKRVINTRFFACSGKRRKFKQVVDTPGYTPLDQYDLGVVDKDLRFLGGLEFALAKKDRDLPTSGSYLSKDPKLKRLQNKAKMRHTRLVFFPSLSTKRKSNTSYYDHKRKLIVWKLEWHFPSSNVTFTEPKVPETTPLFTSLSNVIQNAENKSKISQYFENGLEPSAWSLFFRAEKIQSKEHLWYKLTSSETLKAALENKIVVENPTIHIVLPCDVDKYKIISEEERDKSLTSADQQLQRSKQRKPKKFQNHRGYKNKSQKNKT